MSWFTDNAPSGFLPGEPTPGSFTPAVGSTVRGPGGMTIGTVTPEAQQSLARQQQLRDQGWQHLTPFAGPGYWYRTNPETGFVEQRPDDAQGFPAGLDLSRLTTAD